MEVRKERDLWLHKGEEIRPETLCNLKLRRVRNNDQRAEQANGNLVWYPDSRNKRQKKRRRT